MADGQGGPHGARGSAEAFAAVRSRALHTGPASLGLPPPGPGSGQVFGVIMDTTYAAGTATLAVLTDGTVSLCTSTGGGVIGAGDSERVAAAARRLLATAENQLSLFAPGGGSDLPRTGETRITVRTYTGPLSVTAAEEELGGGHHPVSPVFFSAYRVITELHKLGPGATPAAGIPAGGPTPLMSAAHHGDQRAVFILIGQGAGLEAKDQAGYTALMYAANAGRDEIVRLLLSGGADPSARDYQGSTPLMFAAQHDHLGIVRQLLSAGADPSARGIHGLTALDFAHQNGHHRTITALTPDGLT